MTDIIKANHVTGMLTNARLCKIERTQISFLFAYIVSHSNPSFNVGDWFVSSYVICINDYDDYYLIKTANSVYQVPYFEEIEIPESAIEMVLSGTPPQTALALLKSRYVSNKTMD